MKEPVVILGTEMDPLWKTGLVGDFIAGFSSFFSYRDFRRVYFYKI